MQVSRVHIDLAHPDQAKRIIEDNISRFGPASVTFAFANSNALRSLATMDIAPFISSHFAGASSCRKAATDLALSTSERNEALLMSLHDPEGQYAVASGSLDQNPRQMASMLVTEAMASINRLGQVPSLIWVLQAPGSEEEVLRGIRDILGHSVPVFGGSSADNNVEGEWLQFDGKHLYTNGLVVCVMYPSTPLATYFSSGYSATELSGMVTEVDNRRLISIDNRPAAEVYNQWAEAEGLTTFDVGNILATSTWCPFGRNLLTPSDVSAALLSHPAEMHADGSISLFSEVKHGETLTFMKGEPSLLIERAGTVVKTATRQLKTLYDVECVGALVIFCGGCMLAIEDKIDLVNTSIKQNLPNTPYLMGFTFGEQGCFSDGQNRHGNLMISAVVFGTAP